MIGRRAAFGLAFRKLAGAVADVRMAATAVTAPPPAWSRPPYALDEAHFLLACDRCDACIAACGPGVLAHLPRSAGTIAHGTPALKPATAPCLMCDGWPCAAACDRGALVLPQPDEEGAATPLPHMATARIDTSACLPHAGPECGACASSCPLPGALIWIGTRPEIGGDCTGCGLCRQACITDPKAIVIGPLQ